MIEVDRLDQRPTMVGLQDGGFGHRTLELRAPSPVLGDGGVIAHTAWNDLQTLVCSTG
jgi:hypothetical protein